MTTRKYSSRSQQTTLSGALNTTATSVTVVSATALLGGASVSSGQTFTVVIDPDTALEEIVDVTAVSTNTLTIVRGVENAGTGQAHSAGAVVRHMAIGRDFREANEHIENTTTAHGLTIADVATTTNTKTLTNKTISAADNTLTGVATLTGTQTLTNKTLTSPTITGTGAIAGTFTGNLTGNVTGNVSGSAGSATGNAGTATALQTARNFQLTGDVEASAVSFDGTGNVSLTTGIATGAIVNADINASAAISYSKLNLAGTITSSDIVDGTIVNADINASAAIALSKLATDPLARANHTGTQTASTISDFDTQVRTSKVTDLAAPTGSFSMNSQKITSLATPTTSTDAATKGYVDTQITNLVDSAPGALDTLNELAAALGDDASFSTTVTNSLAGKLNLSGGTMTGALTLSGAPSSNLHAATKAYVDSFAANASADAAAAAASAAAAAASYDSFDDRYLGAKASAPSVDNDGNALTAGALYFNTTTGAMQVYDAVAAAWEGITSAVTSSRWSKTAAGGETTLNGTDDNAVSLSYTAGYEQVYLNGVLLARGGDYTASNGSSITGISALTAGDIVEVLSWTPYSVANALTVTTIDAKGDLLVGTASDTIGRLAVGTNGYILTADSSQAQGIKWAAAPEAGFNPLMLMGA